MSESEQSKIDAIWRQLEKKPLPVLDSSLQLLRQTIESTQQGYQHVQQDIAHDPLFVFNYLSFTRQQHAGKQPSFSLNTPKHAAMLLGFTQIENFIKQTRGLDKYPHPAVKNKLRLLAFRGFFSAHQARNLARILREKNQDQIFFSALLMPIPEILLWHLQAEQSQRYEILIHEKNIPPPQAQLQVFGFTFADFMANSPAHIHVPELALQAMGIIDLEEMKNSIACLYLSDQLARLVEYGWSYKAVSDFLEFAEMITPFKAQRLSREFIQTTVSLSDEASLYYTRAPAIAFLALQSGKVPYTRVLVAQKDAPGKPEKFLKQRKTVKVADKVTDKPGTPPPAEIKLSTAMNLPSLIQMTITKLIHTKKFDTIYLFMLDKSKTKVVIRLEKTLSQHSLINQAVDLETKNLFSLLLQKPHPIFVKETEYEKHQHLLTPVYQLIPNKNFYAKGFHYKNKPIGIFYATHQKITNNEGFRIFKQVMVEFDNQLSKLS